MLTGLGFEANKVLLGWYNWIDWSQCLSNIFTFIQVLWDPIVGWNVFQSLKWIQDNWYHRSYLCLPIVLQTSVCNYFPPMFLLLPIRGKELYASKLLFQALSPQTRGFFYAINAIEPFKGTFGRLIFLTLIWYRPLFTCRCYNSHQSFHQEIWEYEKVTIRRAPSCLTYTTWSCTL